MIIDPVSDLIVRLKNASDAGKQSVIVTRSKLTENIAHVLKKAGYISSVEEKGKDFNKTLELGIVHNDLSGPRIHGVERISKSSRRMYCKYSDIRVFKSGFGNTVLSTPKGIMIDMEAKRAKVGGEILFRIW